MPQKRSAVKELKKSQKRHILNLARKKKIKDAIKHFKKSLQNKEIESAKTQLKDVYKTLDKAAAKKTIHRNKAARKKSRMTLLLAKTGPSSKSPTDKD